jgi:phospholipid transport system substrate-binding protein
MSRCRVIVQGSAQSITDMKLLHPWIALCALAFAAASPARADTAPDELIRQVSVEVIDLVKADKAIQAGDAGRIIALVDGKVMPHVNFQRMTASAVGRNWRSATPEQQKRLQEEFKILLVRSYAGALTQVKDQTVQLKPMRGNAGDNEVVVRTEIKGKGEPVQLDYRLEKVGDSWKIYDVNVLGVWLVEQYRTSFNQEIAASGIDGLIAKLAERNKASAKS